MCDSHLHTLGGKREDLDVNISYSQHSSLLLLYSTLSAVLVCVCVGVCVHVYVFLTVPVSSSPHLHSFPSHNSWVSSQAGHWPRSIYISLFSPYCQIQVQSRSFFAQMWMLLTEHSNVLLHIYYLWVICLLSCIQSTPGLFVMLSVPISLSGVWRNVIFCLSPSVSGFVCLCCY